MLSALFLLFLGITERNTGFLMLGGIVVLCVAMFAYMTGQVPKRQFKKDKRLINTAQYYVFAPDGFIIEMKGDGIDSREDVFYGDLFKIYETRDAFYLYADKMSAFIVLKKDLRDFTPEQASKFLKSKVPDYKYIVTK